MKNVKRILYVDDNKDTCEMMSTFLGLLGYEVVLAHTKSEALKKAKTDSCDLFIFDTFLPDGNGIDLCKEVRLFEPTRPIVFCSGVALEPAKQDAILAGAQAYIVKPVDMGTLGQMIRQVLEGDGATASSSRFARMIPLETRAAEIDASPIDGSSQRSEFRHKIIERSRKLTTESKERIARSKLAIEQTTSRTANPGPPQRSNSEQDGSTNPP